MSIFPPGWERSCFTRLWLCDKWRMTRLLCRWNGDILSFDPHPLHAALEVLERKSLDSSILLSLDLSQDAVATGNNKQQNGIEKCNGGKPVWKWLLISPGDAGKKAFLVGYNLIVSAESHSHKYRFLADCLNPDCRSAAGSHTRALLFSWPLWIS